MPQQAPTVLVNTLVIVGGLLLVAATALIWVPAAIALAGLLCIGLAVVLGASR